MTISTYSNVQQNLAYALSEMGEAMTLAPSGTTVSTVKAIDNKTAVLAPGTSIAAAETHVLAVHPQIGKIVG